MPAGWIATTTTRPVPSDTAGAGWSLTHRERLWVYSPDGVSPPTDQQWVAETAFDGLSTCCP